METKTKVLMVFLMLVLFIGTAVSASADEKYYMLKLHYDKGKLSLNSVSVMPGTFNTIEPGIGYRAELLSFEGKPLSAIRFEIPLEILTDEVDLNTGEIAGGAIKREILDFIVRMKYATNGKTINIYNPDNKKLLSIDVGYFAQVCGNKVCEAHESYESCTLDCKSGGKDDFCDKVKDGKCDPDCSAEADVDCKVAEKPAEINWLLIGGIAAAIIIILIAMLVAFKKGLLRRLFK